MASLLQTATGTVLFPGSYGIAVIIIAAFIRLCRNRGWTLGRRRPLAIRRNDDWTLDSRVVRQNGGQTIKQAVD
jgi:hypothetical protein